MKLSKLRQNIFYAFIGESQVQHPSLVWTVDLSKDKKIEVSGKIFMVSRVGVSACNMIIIIVN